jgi:tRNA(Ile)-lysidine synthase
MYHGAVAKLAQSVLEYVRRLELLKAGDRVAVAVSGGADSVALLRLLMELRLELGVVLSVVHFNHGLRADESDADAQFVTLLAQRNDLELHCDRGDVTKHAASRHLSTEAAARQLRYQYFWRLLEEKKLSRIATGHTLDDQAETVLLRLVRGAGTRGLAGIYPQLSVGGSQFPASIVRPLLTTRRTQLEAYLKEIAQEWRDDSSNRDLRYARNRVRHGIVPRLERSLNPAVRETLAEMAEIAQAEEEFWQPEMMRVLPTVWEAARRCFRLPELGRLPLALRRRVVRAAAESLGLRLEFKHVEEVLGLTPTKSAMLPGGWILSRTKAALQFDPADREGKAVSIDYEYAMPVPGVVQVPEIQASFEAVVVRADVSPGYNPDQVFDPALLGKELTVRNWRAGDRFWPAHSKSPKKVKELLQERKLTGRARRLWPVVASGPEIVWVRGFPAPARLRPREGATEILTIWEHSDV